MTNHARAADAADRDVLTAMMVQLYVEDPSPHGMTTEKAARTLDGMWRDPIRGVAVVLERDGAVAGYCVLVSFLSNELGGTVCTVDEIFVRPEFRGHGLTTWFVERLLRREWPWFQDAVAVELEVTPSNARARALYERLGFKPRKNATLRIVV